MGEEIKGKRLSILSCAEQEALYGLPDFDDTQRLEYLALSETELAIVNSRPGVTAQAYCVLQIGYFKAKQAFFRFDLCDVEGDFSFVLSRYFRGEPIEKRRLANMSAIPSASALPRYLAISHGLPALCHNWHNRLSRSSAVM